MKTKNLIDVYFKTSYGAELAKEDYLSIETLIKEQISKVNFIEDDEYEFTKSILEYNNFQVTYEAELLSAEIVDDIVNVSVFVLVPYVKSV